LPSPFQHSEEDTLGDDDARSVASGLTANLPPGWDLNAPADLADFTDVARLLCDTPSTSVQQEQPLSESVC